jgi:hypothetical protein
VEVFTCLIRMTVANMQSDALAHAAHTADPIVKERLVETAQGWIHLAADFQKYVEATAGQEPMKRSALVMARAPKSHGREWSREEVKALRQLVRENTPTRVIGPQAGPLSYSNLRQGSARRHLIEADEPIALWLNSFLAGLK